MFLIAKSISTNPLFRMINRMGHSFEVFSIKKFIHFIKLLNPIKNKTKHGPFIPIIPTEGFVYGGAFIPIEAVREAPLPDASLFSMEMILNTRGILKSLGMNHTYVQNHDYMILT